MQQMQGWHHRCLGLLCDVRVRSTVENVIQESILHWKRIDIIVKYAGTQCSDANAWLTLRAAALAMES